MIRNSTIPALGKDSFSGMLLITFVINRAGSPEDIGVGTGMDEFCLKDIVQVLEAMPTWKPGIQDGKPVKVSVDCHSNESYR